MCGRPGRATQAPNRVLLYKPRSLAELERHDGGRREAVQLRRAIGNLPPGLARAAFVAFSPTFFGYEATPPPAFVRFQVRVRTSVGGVHQERERLGPGLLRHTGPARRRVAACSRDGPELFRRRARRRNTLQQVRERLARGASAAPVCRKLADASQRERAGHRFVRIRGGALQHALRRVLPEVITKHIYKLVLQLHR